MAVVTLVTDCYGYQERGFRQLLIDLLRIVTDVTDRRPRAIRHACVSLFSLYYLLHWYADTRRSRVRVFRHTGESLSRSLGRTSQASQSVTSLLLADDSGVSAERNNPSHRSFIRHIRVSA